jgi:hypothetical protein
MKVAPGIRARTPALLLYIISASVAYGKTFLLFGEKKEGGADRLARPIDRLREKDRHALN